MAWWCLLAKNFLLLPEIDQNLFLPYTTTQVEPEVELKNFSATWEDEKSAADQDDDTLPTEQTPLLENHREKSKINPGPRQRLVLEDINFSISGNKLVAIVGSVGSSKSSLLLALLKEITNSAGHCSLTGSVAYAAQSPWVFPSTIRQNIQFGREFHQERYAEVLEATALLQDLSLLPNGDQSLVGEKGVTLSGGQKARVALARAVYAQSDIFLLDDPLSAVDSKVGRHIFDRCINGYLKNTLRFLVTHQSQYLKKVDNIIVLQEGKVLAIGSYGELVKSGLDLEHIIGEDAEQDEDKVEDEISYTTGDSTTEESADINKLKKQLVLGEQERQVDEDRAIGKIGLRVYKDFFTAGAPLPVVLLVFLLCALTQGSYNVSDWWLSVWSAAEETKQAGNATTSSTGSNQSIPQLHSSMADTLLRYLHNQVTSSVSVYNMDTNTTMTSSVSVYGLDTYTSVAVYMGITGLTLLLGVARSLSFHRVTIHSSRNLHDRMYESVIRSPVRFYDTNPKGRILNRFSGDTSSLDFAIPDIMLDCFQYTLMVVGNLVLISVFNPWTLIPTIPLIIVLILVRLRFIRIQREIQKSISEAYSPMLTHLNATLEGVQTIRAFRNQDICIRDFHAHYNTIIGGWFTEIAIFCWFQFRMNILSATYNVASVFIITLLAGTMDAGQAGLTLSYIMPMMWYVEKASRLSADLEIEMVKAERVLRYTRLSPEAPLTSQAPPPPSWPQRGAIQLDNVSLRYHEDGPYVLKNLNIRIEAGSKVGVVGRTGAGKSSLIQALFRTVEPEGKIFIDDVITRDLGLHELRSVISIIPQDPVLFKGTVRFNMDPFKEHSDANIWSVLEEVQLKKSVSDLDGGLDADVTEGGGNFSVGEKQLFCLGRAILRNNKILVIDEATANVDKRTDSLVQKSLREKFANCTVLTIAHRINTIMDSDYILVMSDGEIAEYGKPDVLLLDQSSHFYNIVQQSQHHS